MSHTERRRDAACESMERLGFVILQHLLNLRGEERSAQRPAELATGLAISTDELATILGRMSDEGLVYWAGPLSPVTLSTRGAEYLRREAGRRHSVRVFSCTA
jgi:hypothetical protein